MARQRVEVDAGVDLLKLLEHEEDSKGGLPSARLPAQPDDVQQLVSGPRIYFDCRKQLIHGGVHGDAAVGGAGPVALHGLARGEIFLLLDLNHRERAVEKSKVGHVWECNAFGVVAYLLMETTKARMENINPDTTTGMCARRVGSSANRCLSRDSKAQTRQYH
jgi:hypothetical protein